MKWIFIFLYLNKKELGGIKLANLSTVVSLKSDDDKMMPRLVSLLCGNPKRTLANSMMN